MASLRRQYLPPVLGVVLSSLLVPAAVAITLHTTGTLPDPLPLGATAIGIVAVGWATTTTIDRLAERVVRPPVVFAGLGVVILAAVGTALTTNGAGASEPIVLGTIGSMTLAGVGWVAAAVVGGRLRARDRLADATTYADIDTGEENGPLSRALGLVLLSGVIVMFVSMAAIDIEGNVFGAVASVSGLSTLLLSDDATSVRVTSEGVMIDGSFRPIETIDSYHVTDEQFEIKRTTWWRPTVSIDREEMSTDTTDRLHEGLERMVNA